MRMPRAESARLMSGIPSRSMPAIKPAPKFDRAGIGEPARRTPQPVPCTIWIFSSRVIWPSTMSARSSGESDLFIQGFVRGIFAVPGAVLACAREQPKVASAITTAKTDAAPAAWDSLEDGITAPSCLCDKLAPLLRPAKSVFQILKSLNELKRYSKAFVLR